MMLLITGGSSSGKSKYAENRVAKLGENRFYIATMKPFDKEAENRIEAHRQMRKDKNFETIEKYKNVSAVEIPQNATVLLECVSNLLANEMFSGDCGKKVNLTEKITADIQELSQKCENLVVVTNEVFADGARYDEFCEEYISVLGAINCKLAQLADEVIEVVVGLPISHK